MKSPYITKDEVKKHMTRDKDQKMRFNNAELSLTKAVFADNEELIFAIRKVMYQFPLNESEEKIIKDTMNPSVHALIKKFFLPELEPDAPLFQLTDMVNTLSLDMKAKGVEDMLPLFDAKEIEITYLAQRLEELEGKEVKDTLNLSDLAALQPFESAYQRITARNYILSWVDSNLQQIQFLAGKKEESVEDTVARLHKDSNK